MSILLGLLSMVGLGYAVHKSEKYMRIRNANAVQRFGAHITSNDKLQIYNEKQREVMDFFNSRVSFYYQNPDRITDVLPKAYYSKEAQEVEGINGDYIKRMAASMCAYIELNNRYCPNYTRYVGAAQGGARNLSTVILGLARKEVLRRGGKTDFMFSTNSPCPEDQIWNFPENIEFAGHDYLPNYEETKHDPKWHVDEK